MITKLYKKFIDKIIGEEQTPLHVFNCTKIWQKLHGNLEI